MTSTGVETPATATSPDKIAEQIFESSPYHAVRFLKCDYCDGVLTIQGRLPSYYLKQTAQNAVQGLDGVKRIVNLAEVAVT
jgi:hypothetical protein